MIIIIEGPDGSGKTTLARQLASQTGWPILHRSAPKNAEDKLRMFEQYKDIIRDSKDVIFDRCWYSEMAYGPTMRDETCIGYPDMFELERALTKNGAIIIYCTDDPEILWSRCQRRGEDYVLHKADFVDICEAYDEIMNVPHLIPVVKYGYKDLS